MAAGLPVAASRIGGLSELVPDNWAAPVGDSRALAEVIGRLRRPGGGWAGDRPLPGGCSPNVAARAPRDVYAAVGG